MLGGAAGSAYKSGGERRPARLPRDGRSAPMPLFVITLPPFDKVAIPLGPFGIRWYALAYIAGILIGWRYCLRLSDHPPRLVRRNDVDDFIVWATLGVVLGGRLGYILFYNFALYLQHPLQMLYVWRGGMSFHGGALGVTIAIILFARRRRIPVFAFSDIVCEAIPIGLFFGRIANFINGELYGRPAASWARSFAMIYPSDPLRLPRYPSELFEAVLEGICLFVVLRLAERRGARARSGVVTGIFLVGYAAARIAAEFFREPDPQRGYFTCQILCTTEGQLLSLPVLLIGLLVILWARRRPPVVALPR
jgi:phosphatidylglycerol---prolipoprotein diacylglyceryl transferase